MWALSCSLEGASRETGGFIDSLTKSWSLPTLLSVQGGLMGGNLLWIIRATTQLLCLLEGKTSFSLVLALIG